MWLSFPWIQKNAATVYSGNRFLSDPLGTLLPLFTSGTQDDSAEVGRDASPPRAQEVVPTEPSKPPGKVPGEVEWGSASQLNSEQWVGAREGPNLSELKFNVHLPKTDLRVPWWLQTLEPSTPVPNTAFKNQDYLATLGPTRLCTAGILVRVEWIRKQLGCTTDTFSERPWWLLFNVCVVQWFRNTLYTSFVNFIPWYFMNFWSYYKQAFSQLLWAVCCQGTHALALDYGSGVPQACRTH